jgi:hypothetical protein
MSQITLSSLLPSKVRPQRASLARASRLCSPTVFAAIPFVREIRFGMMIAQTSSNMARSHGKGEILMKRIIGTILTAGMVVAFAACGGTDNQQACKDLYAKINGLSCIGTSVVDAELACPAAYNDTDYDYTDYFACLEGAYECDGDMLDDAAFGKLVSCTPPTS